MEGTVENYIYPSAFNPCILRCFMENGKQVTTLYMEHTYDTFYVQLSFTENMFKEESLFRCDYMEAKDGGLPFLIVTDIIKCKSRDYCDQKYGIRLELTRLLLEDPEFFDINSFANEYRVRCPMLFDIAQISEVFTHVIPNFYGVAHGVAFTRDGFPELVKTNDNNFLLKRTKLPEVYELYLDGVTPVSGNNVAYIPNMEVSKTLKNRLQNRNSIRTQCSFDESRQKWVPIML